MNDNDTIFDMLQFVHPAVTYHTLYNYAATTAKTCMSKMSVAATASWRQLFRALAKNVEADSSNRSHKEIFEAEFDKLDTENTGYLTKEQLHAAISGLGLDISAPAVGTMISEAMADQNASQIDKLHFLRAAMMVQGTWKMEGSPEGSAQPSRQPSRAPSDVDGTLKPSPRQDVRSKTFDLVILGAGPVGLKSATEAASRGQHVALIDPKKSITGAPTGAHSKCLREAALSGAKTWAEVEKCLTQTVDKSMLIASESVRTFNITFLHGRGEIMNENLVHFSPAAGGPEIELNCEVIIIATGSKANRFPPVDFTLAGVYDSDTIQGIDRLPKSILIQGAGIVGLEYGLIFRKLGCEVIIVETFDQVVPMLDSTLQQACIQTMTDNGVEILVKTPIKSVTAEESSTPNMPALVVDLGDRVVKCDCLLASTGRSGCTSHIGLEKLMDKGLKIGRAKVIEVDENGYTGVGRVYAVGDCASGSLMLATMGQSQAIRAVRANFGSGLMATEQGKTVKPFGIWTIPEVAWAGLTEKQAGQTGVPVGTAIAQYQDTLRGCVNSESGFLKIVFNRDNGKVLGVHICGENACELINYGAKVCNDGETIYEVLNFVFPAVTYHLLYHSAATEAKIKKNGQMNIAAITTWKQVQAILQKSLDLNYSNRSVRDLMSSAFKKFDQNLSGFLTKAELQKAFLSFGVNLDSDAINDFVHETAHDVDAESFEYEMFLKAMGA